MKLPTKVMAEEATCEDLERFAISGDPEKFFLGWCSIATSRKGGVSGIP